MREQVDQERCDLCRGGELTFEYQPAGGARGLRVHVCSYCGLVQSLPRIDHVDRTDIALSSDAGWGNVRYGKGFRADAALEKLRGVLNLESLHLVLDVGSSRGSFALGLQRMAPQVLVTAIEPDGRLVEPYRHDPGIETVTKRVEEVDLPGGRYDLVHCSHTLEHLRSPREVLKRLRDALKPTGFLFIEVPSIAFVGRDDVVEEWFIDKHLYHYGIETFQALLGVVGLDPLPGTLEHDGERISTVVRPGPVRGVSPAPEVVWRTKRLLHRYVETLNANRRILRLAVKAMHEMARERRIVIWGAGRIFDALVRYGGLNPGMLVGLIDKYLCRYLAETHGLPILSPDRLPSLRPQVVLVASRSYHGEIAAEVRRMVPDCAVMGFDDVLRFGSDGSAGFEGMHGGRRD